eukprot:scpid76582/ scgid11213/ 
MSEHPKVHYTAFILYLTSGDEMLASVMPPGRRTYIMLTDGKDAPTYIHSHAPTCMHSHRHACTHPVPSFIHYDPRSTFFGLWYLHTMVTTTAALERCRLMMNVFVSYLLFT